MGTLWRHQPDMRRASGLHRVWQDSNTMASLKAVRKLAVLLPCSMYRNHLKYSKNTDLFVMPVAQAFAWSLQLPLLAILPAHEAHHADAVVQTDAERQLAVEGAVEGTVAAASPLVGEDGLTTPLLQSPALDDGETEKQ